MIRLEIPFPTPSQNERDRMHPEARKRLKERFARAIMVGLALNRRFGLQRPNERVRVKITRFSAGTLDKGNLIGGCKDLLDALTEMRVIRDDKPKWLDDDYAQGEAAPQEGRTVVEVER